MRYSSVISCLVLGLSFASCEHQCRISYERIPPPVDPIPGFDDNEYSFFYMREKVVRGKVLMVVHSHATDTWARLLAIPTEGGRFGYVDRSSEEAVDMSTGGWDHRRIAEQDSINPLELGIPGIRRNGEVIELHYNFNNIYSRKYKHGSTMIPIRTSDLDCIFTHQ